MPTQSTLIRDGSTCPTGTRSAAQYSRGIQHALLIERPRRSRLLPRHEHAGHFRLRRYRDGQPERCHSRRSPAVRRRVIDQHALAAIVDARVVLREDHVVEPDNGRLAVDRDRGRSECRLDLGLDR